MYSNLDKVLVSKEQIESKVKELAAKISEDYKGLNPLFVCILKGSVFFFADLLRNITIPAQMDFMSVSSYGAGTQTSGVVKIIKDLDAEVVNGADLLIVEDILDSGVTLEYLMKILSVRNPNSIKICTLLDKPERRKANVFADYAGAQIPDAFVVGYGLDYDEKYRNLPFVGALKPAVYEK